MKTNPVMRRAAALLVGTGVVAAALAGGSQVKLEKSLAVPRCQAVLADGSQCPQPADKDTGRCWRHRGAAKAVNDAFSEAGKELDAAWTEVRDWSTNAWQETRASAGRAWTGSRTWATNTWRRTKSGAGRAVKGSREWATNAWEQTARGTGEAWGATKDAFEEAGKEISEEVSEAFKKEDAKAKAK